MSSNESSNKENTLLITCGDKRLGAKFLSAMEAKLGKKFYVLAVPGPDAGVMGDKEHEMNLIAAAKRFYDLTGFTELVIAVHEDCAGCQCDTEAHEQNAPVLARRVAYGVGFTGVRRSFIARRPTNDDYDIWEPELLEEVAEDVIAA